MNGYLSCLRIRTDNKVSNCTQNRIFPMQEEWEHLELPDFNMSLLPCFWGVYLLPKALWKGTALASDCLLFISGDQKFLSLFQSWLPWSHEFSDKGFYLIICVFYHTSKSLQTIFNYQILDYFCLLLLLFLLLSLNWVILTHHLFLDSILLPEVKKLAIFILL